MATLCAAEKAPDICKPVSLKAIGPEANIDYKTERKEKIMSVKLRMMRIGRRHRPFFRINAIDGRAPRNGKIIEKLGHYDPIEKDKEKQLVLNLDRIKYWLEKGAVPSDSVSEMLSKVGIKHKYAVEKTTRHSRARKLVRAKGRPFTKAEKLAAQKPAEGEKTEEKKEQQT